MQHEIIQLQHMPAQEILPLIQPFLAESGSITAEGDVIILDTTDENLQQIKILIQKLDVPSKQLQISVSLDPAVVSQNLAPNKAPSAQQNDKPAEVIQPAVAPDNSLIYKSTGREVSPGIQLINVLQDRWSMIRTGQSIPVIKRLRNPDGTITESISYQQINQGLRIKPHLTHQQVTLYVQPFYEADNQSGPGKKLYYKQEQISHATLGDWFALDTISGIAVPVDKNWIQQNQLASNPIKLIFLKVDVAP